MELTVPVLVGFMGNERLEVRVPFVAPYEFVGPSEAELLDDAALHLMEHIPQLSARGLSDLVLSPEICLRRVTIDQSLRFGSRRKGTAVKVKLTCVCSRWAPDRHWTVWVPRLGNGRLAVRSLSDLKHAVPDWLAEWAKTGTLSTLEAAASLQDEHIELVEVEVELPTVLPSRVPKKRKKKKKATDTTAPEKRKWVPAYELSQVAVNLLHRAMDGRLAPALNRDALVADLVEQLQHEGAAILLVGEPGVGKTAVIEAVAQAFAAQEKSLQERTDLWRVDGARLIAGMCFVGSWEGRMGAIVHELTHRQDVLVVDDLPSLAWTGRSAQSETTMAGFLLPHLQRGEIRVLAECSAERLEAGRQKNPGFFSCFRVIRLDAMDTAQTAQVLLQHQREVERVRTLVASPKLLPTVLALSRRFGPPMAEPGRSVVLLRRFLGEVVATKTDRVGRGRIGPAQLLAHFGEETGLPAFVLEPGAARSVSEIRNALQRHIVGQEGAVETVVDVVAALQQGLDDPDRPVATLLFVGPTGVGKTETAKALAHVLFGSADRMLRFDMSEVKGPGALRRLVGGPGAPDGDLTRAVSNQPFSVVLLDEIEKAGPQVFDLLLQVLGEGRLTNAVGRTTDFRNTVLILTSNLGVAQSRRRTGFGSSSTSADATHYRKAAQAFFRPEFYNRLDHVVPFRTLGPADVEPLVQRIVGRVLGRRGLRRSGVVVRLDDGFRDWLARVGFDPVYGARSLQRVVERELTVPLARLLVGTGPLDQGAFIDVWRDDALHLELHALEDGAVDPGRRALPSDWSAVAALHRTLLDRAASVEAIDRWDAVLAERSKLLDRAGSGLSEPEWDALNTATAIVETRGSVDDELEEFAERWLASYQYDDGYEVLKPGIPNTWRYAQRQRVVTRHTPIPVDRARTLGTAIDTLLALELQVGALLHRVRHFGDPTPFVIRVEPLHDEAGPLADTVARAFAEAWSGWGPVACHCRDGGTWRLAEAEDRVEAVSMDCAGLAALLAPDMGLMLDATEVGADRLLRLVRVECLRGEPETALPERDAVQQASNEAMRRGEARGEALPAVVHRFGVLRPDDPLAPRLDHLASDLRRLALRRVEAG